MELYSVEYTLLGLMNPHCMKLLPMTGPKLTQKVVAGNKEGIASIFYVKSGEIQTTFKSLPGPPITNVVLGGSIGTVQDKVFVSCGTEVHGYTKKGKMFLKFETQLLESITHMYVSGNDLLVTGVYNYHHYHDCKLADTYVCHDAINDVIALNALKVRRLIVVLACNDHVLRVIDCASVIQTFTCASKPTKLHLLNGDGGNNGDCLLVGVQGGQIHLIRVTRTGPMEMLWTIEDGSVNSEVTCITCFDMSKSGTSDVIIGRQDGTIEVYSGSQTDDALPENRPPIKKFSYCCNESITSIQAGYVGSPNFEEIVVTTFTGLLFGLTTEVPEKRITSTERNKDYSYGLSKDEQQKISKLKAEIEEIEGRVAKEREKYLLLTKEGSLATSRLPYLEISSKVTLQREDACYLIVLETETNIDNVLIQSDVPIRLLDVDKNSAVVSYSKCDDPSKDGNAVLATYRCQLNTTRLELKYYTTEGQKGTLQVYVTPLTQPKCCHLKQFPILPLSLHYRIHEMPTERVYNVLQLKGSFSLAEMHSWLTQCLPEIPEKLMAEDGVEYMFENALSSTILLCCYKRGEAEFKSDSISTMFILKDFLSKQAIKKKVKIDVSSAVNEDSIIFMLRTLRPKLEKYYQLEQNSKILEALKDIDTAQAGQLSGYLCDEYNAIMQSEAQLKAELTKCPFYFERLQNIVIEMFVDWHKNKGINVKPKLSLFVDTLKNHYNHEEICGFF